MFEILADGERRGREHPRAGPSLDIPAEPLGHLERRELQRHAVRVGVYPADARLFRHRGERFERARERRGAPAAVRRSRSGTEPLELGRNGTQGRLERGQGIEEAIRETRPLVTSGTAAKRGTELFEERLDRAQSRDSRGRPHAGILHLRRGIPQQELHLPNRPGLSKELSGGLRHLVGLVQNDGLRAGQQIAESLVLEREIREQQMMIHHHDLSGLRGAARLHHVAA